MTHKTLITSQQGAVAASSATGFEVRIGEPATISATALQSAERVSITYSADSSAAFNGANAAMILTPSDPIITISDAGFYRVSKVATVGNCAVIRTPYFGY